MSRIQVEEVCFFPLRPPTIAPSIKGGGIWGEEGRGGFCLPSAYTDDQGGMEGVTSSLSGPHNPDHFFGLSAKMLNDVLQNHPYFGLQ